ncbi:hypothetical protein T484DRAFT_1854207, partial [Baffinella frigidus]
VDLPKRWQGPASAGQKAPQRLVGGDAGSMRQASAGLKAPQRLVGGDAGSMCQAAPYVPGDSKAGASQEGWTEDQLEKILDEERKWKEQVAAKEGTENQLEKILVEERKWKEQVAAKEAEEHAANQLAGADAGAANQLAKEGGRFKAEADAANQLAKKGDRFKVGSKMRVEKGVPSTMESSVVQALVAS